MRLCLFDTVSDAPPVPRLGLLRGRHVIDVHAACLASLAEHMSARRAGEIADALCPSNLLEFLENERHGWRALDDSLNRLGERLDDPDLVTPSGSPVVRPVTVVRLLPLIPWQQWTSSNAGEWVSLPLPQGGALPTTLHSDGRPYIHEYWAVIGTAGENISTAEAWDHVALVCESQPTGPTPAALLRTPDEYDEQDSVLHTAVSVAVSEASHQEPLLIGDVVRTGPPLLAEPTAPDVDEDLLREIVEALR